MGEESTGVLIVTLGDEENAEETKKRVSRIGGVVGIEFNHVTRKLLIRYTNADSGLRQVELEIKKALEGAPDEGSHVRRRSAEKRRR